MWTVYYQACCLPPRSSSLVQPHVEFILREEDSSQASVDAVDYQQDVVEVERQP